MASNDPFGGGGSSHDDSRTPPSNDPFADPFGSDSFGSAGWTGDSTTATASTGLASSTPKGAKTVKKVGGVYMSPYCVAIICVLGHTFQ